MIDYPAPDAITKYKRRRYITEHANNTFNKSVFYFFINLGEMVNLILWRVCYVFNPNRAKREAGFGHGMPFNRYHIIWLHDDD